MVAQARWLPLVGTFGSQGMGPGSKCATAYRSNASAMGRFGVLNEPVGEAWIGAAQSTPPFGRFATNDFSAGGEYNLQVYEPKDEADHASTVAAYLASGVIHGEQAPLSSMLFCSTLTSISV